MNALLKIATFAVFLLCILPFRASAGGPFGLQMAQDLGQLSCDDGNSDGVFSCTSVPNPHPYFTDYLVKYHPRTGVCYVMAAGPTINSDAYGIAARLKTDEIRDQLMRKYGANFQKLDYLKTGSIWD